MNSASLRVGLLLRLGGALVLLLALDAVASYFTALHFANLVYDRWLIDSTHSLAQAVRTTTAKSCLTFPRSGLEVFQFDEVDKTYYRIQSANRGFIAGEAALPVEAPSPIGAIRLANGTVHDQEVRPGVDSDRTGRITGYRDRDGCRDAHQTCDPHPRDFAGHGRAPSCRCSEIALLLAWLGVSRGLKPLTDLCPGKSRHATTTTSPPFPRRACREKPRVLRRAIK